MTPSLAQMRAEFVSILARSEPGLSTADELCTACVSLLGVDGAAVSVVLDGVSRGTFGSSSEASRRLDEYQFTFGEGPCLDAAASNAVVHAPNLDALPAYRWPVLTGALLGDGVRAVFALPVRIASACVGALDFYREVPGPLNGDELAGGMLAAELAALPLLNLVRQITLDEDVDGTAGRADNRDSEQAQALVELDRVEVYQATGMLIAQLDVDASEALLRLRGHAIATGRTASEVAWAILAREVRLERDDEDGREGSGR